MVATVTELTLTTVRTLDPALQVLVDWLLDNYGSPRDGLRWSFGKTRARRVEVEVLSSGRVSIRTRASYRETAVIAGDFGRQVIGNVMSDVKYFLALTA